MRYLSLFCTALVLLLFVLPTEGLADERPYLTCDPRDSGIGPTGVTVCDEGGTPVLLNTLPSITDVTWPADGILNDSADFQIRSCGNQSCNYATHFTLHSANWTDADPSSKEINIPSELVTGTFTQKNNGDNRPFAINSACGNQQNFPHGNCPFRGAGLLQDVDHIGGTDNIKIPDHNICEGCVDFKLDFSVDLNKLIDEGKISQPGVNTLRLRFRIDQSAGSINPNGGGDNDSNQERDIIIPVQLTVPDKLQISGLRDIFFTEKSSVENGYYFNEHNFCVYRFGAGSFTINANSRNVNSGGSGFKLLGPSNKPLGYKMSIKQKGDWIEYKEGLAVGLGEWQGGCPPVAENPNGDTNMALKIEIDQTEAKNATTGAYSDTMTLTVGPN